MSKDNKNAEILAKGEEEAVKKLLRETKAADEKPKEKKSEPANNPYDVVIETAEKALEIKQKHYMCIKTGLPRVYVSLGEFTVAAASSKLVDTGTGWMELAAPSPGVFIDYTEDQAERFVEEVKARVVVWHDSKKIRCSIYKHDFEHKQPGFSAEPLAKYIVFESSGDMTAEQVLAPDDMPTLYDKAEHDLSKT